MKLWGLFRIVAFLITALIVYFTHFFKLGDVGLYYFSGISGAILISHYFMGFWASYPKFKTIASVKRGRLALLAWVLISVLGFYYEPELIIILFGIHFAFSEAYSKKLIDHDRSFFESSNVYRRVFTALQINFLVAGYTCAVQYNMLLVKKLSFLYPVLNSEILVPYFAFSAFLYFGYFLLMSSKIFNKDSSSSDVVLSFVIPDLMLAVGFGLGFYFALSYVVWVLYHIVQWILLPVPNFLAQWRGYKPLFYKYAAPSLLMFLVYFYFHPVEFKTPILASSVGLNPIPKSFSRDVNQIRIPRKTDELDPYVQYYGAPGDSLQYKFYLEVVRWGWLHVLSAFIISSLNPLFIRRAFNVQSVAASKL